MARISEALTAAMELNGAVAAAIGDAEAGLILAYAGNSPGVDLLLKRPDGLYAMVNLMGRLADGDTTEDILLTHEGGFHLLRPISTSSRGKLFLYLGLEHNPTYLAMARKKLGLIASSIQI